MNFQLCEYFIFLLFQFILKLIKRVSFPFSYSLDHVSFLDIFTNYNNIFCKSGNYKNEYNYKFNTYNMNKRLNVN
jgi:hypothetical protein